MDTTEARLLTAIHDAPEDDGPRLVYTDWLLERGDPRGELALVQRELAGEPGPCARHELLRREELLLARVPGVQCGQPIYRGGVLEGLAIDPRDIDESIALPRLLRLTSRTASDGDLEAAVRRVAERSDAAGVRELELDLMELSDPWRGLFHGALRPQRLVLPQLWSTSKAGWMSAGDAAMLALAPVCERIEHLDLSGAIGDAALGALLATPLGARLQTLVVGGARHYTRSAPLGRDERTGPVSDAGVAAITAHARSLRRLDLRWNPVGEAGVRALADSPLALDQLRLTHTALGADGIATLAASRLAPISRVSTGVTHYDRPPDAGAYRALVAAPIWAERALDLWSSEAADFDGVLEAITELPTPPAITEFRLFGSCTAPVLGRFLHSPAAANLRSIALHTRLRGAGARAFAEAIELPLETLELGGCDIGGTGAAALFAAPHVVRLQRLRLAECKLGEAGVRALAKSALRPTELTIHDFTDFRTMLTLLASPVLERVTDLQVQLIKHIVDPRALVKTLVDPHRFLAVQKLALPDLSDLAPEHKRVIAERFGNVLVAPRVAL